ncbi:PhzF family phenazine biosynthesis protein [Corynebacterium senegalense]|uniref:PhzF family phenazine biosynthesis protein n=1 Tax=Corynebacterium senegalense TaxID=2080750 RepID=UPI000E200E1D
MCGVRCDILELDVFSTGLFTGNPLAVIAGADGADTVAMQRVAAWLNYSETTFLLPPTGPGADYRVRIFTASEEFDFAGHPTLGTAAAWLELGGTPAREGVVVQECGAGLVPVRAGEAGFAFATPPLRRSGALSPGELDGVLRRFGLGRSDVVDAAWADNGPGWKVVQLGDVDKLRSLEFSRGGDKVGFVALTGGAEPWCEVRAFTTDREDPVTGSLNGALAQWLRARSLAPESYVADQGRHVGRAGRVEITDDGRDIWVGGKVTARVRGTIDL